MITFKISKEAEKEINRMISLIPDEQERALIFLRVTAKEGGCQGISTEFSLDTVFKDGDLIYRDYNFKVHISKDSFMYLDQAELQLKDGPNGLKIWYLENPNYTKECTCNDNQSR